MRLIEYVNSFISVDNMSKECDESHQRIFNEETNKWYDENSNELMFRAIKRKKTEKK